MSITARQKIKSSDFINESQKNATPANDEGRVPKLESDAQLHTAFNKTAIAGENLTAGDALCKSEYTKGTSLLTIGRTGTTILTITLPTTTYLSQTFTTPNDIGTLKLNGILLDIQNTDSGATESVTVSIRAVDVNNRPTGADLASATKSIVDPFTGLYYFSFSPITLVAGTNYAIVLSGSFSGGGDSIFFKGATSSPYFVKTTISTNSGSTWSDDATTTPIFVAYDIDCIPDGKYYKASGKEKSRSNVVGFAKSTVSASGNVNINNSGNVTLSGLTANTPYYLSTTTKGALQTTASTYGGIIGYALSTTSFVFNIEHKKPFSTSIAIGVPFPLDGTLVLDVGETSIPFCYESPTTLSSVVHGIGATGTVNITTFIPVFKGGFSTQAGTFIGK